MRKKIPLKQYLLLKGIASDEKASEAIIRAGEILVNGQVADKPGTLISEGDCVKSKPCQKYVSRGGIKLDAALAKFPINIAGRVVADVGASTGGFTDCLLQHGATRVYAIDAGYGQLDSRLRHDAKVYVMERTNVRHLEHLPDPIDLVTIDVSFISLSKVLPVVKNWLAPQGNIIALIKPQFEAKAKEVPKGGVIRDAAIIERVKCEVIAHANTCGLSLRGITPSPITGFKGNQEFLAWFQISHP